MKRRKYSRLLASLMVFAMLATFFPGTVLAEGGETGVYSVSVDSSITGGTIETTPTSGTKGDGVTVTVTPDEGKQLIEGSLKYTADGGSSYTDITATEGVYSFAIPEADVIVTAGFEDVPAAGESTSYVVDFSVTGEYGTVAAAVYSVAISSGDAVAAGRTVIFTASPDEGYQVKEWTVNDQPIADNQTNTLSIENLAADQTVTVEFEAVSGGEPEPATYTVAVDSAITGGTVVVDPESAAEGDTVTVTVTPDEGKQLIEGSLKYTTDGGSSYTAISETGGVYSFVLPAADVTVAAAFEDLPPGSNVWDGSLDTSWYTANPELPVYTISTPAQLAGLAYLVNASEAEWLALGLSLDNPDYGMYIRFAGKTITLANDIWLNATASAAKGDTGQRQWIPIGGGGIFQGPEDYTFGGIFDGAGHTVYNVYIDKGGTTTWIANCGFIGQLSAEATIKNLTVTGFVDADRSVGGIVGKNWGTVENCVNYATVKGYQSKGVGGITGANWYANPTTSPAPVIRGCVNYGAVETAFGTGLCGGIAGDNEGLIENCANYGAISAANAGSASIGGIAGNLKIIGGDSIATVRNCFNAGAIIQGQWTAGIAAQVENGVADILNCYNIGSVNGGLCGGILGNHNGGYVAISNCYNTGAITGASGGAIAGKLNANGSTDNLYYLHGSAALPFAIAPATAAAMARTEAEMKADALVARLNGLNGHIFVPDMDDNNNGYPILAWQTAHSIPPVLAADTTNNQIGEPVEITFTDDGNWSGVVSGITVNGAMVSGYTLASGTVTIPAGAFAEAGDYIVAVTAPGYTNAIILQAMQQTGTTYGTVTFMSDGAVYTTVDTPLGSATEAPADPVKDGYTFSGWWTDENYSSAIVFPYTVTENVTVYAKWTEIPAGPLPAPVLKADNTDNNTGQPVTITFTDDAAWRSAITGVTINSLYYFGHLTADQYTVSPGKISIAAEIAAEAFTQAGEYIIIVRATDYKNAMVNQKINEGFAFTYSIDTGQAVITGYTGSGGEIAVPGSIVQGGTAYPTIAIGMSAFLNCTALTSVELPDSMTSIGDNAFNGCTGLTAVTLPTNLSSIGNQAFRGCSNLDTAYFLGDLPTLGADVFQDTPSDFVLCYHAGKAASWSGFTDYTAKSFCTLTLDLQDGSAPVGSYTTVDSSEGHIAAPADPVCPGLTFGGWYKEAACVNAFDFGSETVTGDITLYAKWIGGTQTYTVTTDSAITGGTVAVDPAVGSAGDIITVTVTPAEGKQLVAGSLQYTADGGMNYAAIPSSEDAYRFSLPAANVVVTAQFENASIDFTYTISTGQAVITGYTGSSAEIVVPGSIVQGETAYPTAIGNNAFNNRTELTSVMLSDGLTSIGDSAFLGCTGLTTITLPDSLTSIGTSSFQCCTGLTSVTLPASVNSIGDRAFRGCLNLGAAYFLGDLPATFSGNVFQGAKSGFVLYYHVDKAASWSGYANYPNQAFCVLTLDLQNGSTPESSYAVLTDGRPAAPADPTRDNYTFGGWYKEAACVNSFDFGSETVTGDVAVYAKWNASIDFTYTISTGQAVITGYTGSSAEIAVPGSIVQGGTAYPTAIGENAFKNRTELTSVTLSDGLTSIGNSAFNGCTGLTTIMLPDSLTSIDTIAFSGCTGLTSVTLPDGLTSIGNSTFSGCTGLTTITLPASVSSIGMMAFRKCSNLGAAYFLGDLPATFSLKVFKDTKSGFVLYYHVNKAASWSSFTSYTTGVFCILTLDLQDGNAPESSFAVIDSNGYIDAPTDPARGGYTFGGWYKEAACVNVFDFESETVTGDVTVYAKWIGEAETYSVTVDSSITGGSVTVDPASAAAGGTITVTVTPDESKQLVAGSLNYNDGTADIEITATEDMYSFTMPAADVVVTAGFEDIPAAGEAGSLKIAFVMPGYTSGTVAITLDHPAGAGYSFVYAFSYGPVSGLTIEDTIQDGSSFTDGAEIEASAGQYITIYEINSTYHILNYVSRQITESDLGITAGDYVFVITDADAHTVAIVRYNGAGGAVTIPATVNIGGTDYTVTAIADGMDMSHGAFNGAKTTLTSVTLPDSLTAIGAYAFSSCSALTAATLGSGLKTMGAHAFERCDNAAFTSVIIPDGVTRIDGYTFLSCSALKTVTLGSSVTSVGDFAFGNCTSLAAVYFKSSKPPAFGTKYFNNTASNFALYYHAANAGGSADPTSWAYFADHMATYTVNAFCVLTLNSNYSGGAATSGKAAVSSGGLLAYPAAIPSREGYVFNGWYKNAACTDDWDFGSDPADGDLTLYAGWTQGAAPGSLTITSVQATGTIGGRTLITLASSAGTGNSFVYKVSNMPVSGLTTAGTVTDGAAFTSGSTVIAVAAGQYVTIYEITAEQTIVNYVCRQIAAGEITAGVNIGDFNYILKNTSSGHTAAVKSYTGSGGAVVIPGTVEYNGTTYNVTALAGSTFYTNGVFSGNTAITSVTLPDSLQTIGDYAFYGCTGLTSANLGSGLTTIGWEAFNRCSQLAAITLPNGVTSIGDYAFADCRGLTAVKLPDGLTQIGPSIFNSCSNLASVTIGSGVTSIGERAFIGCSKLTSITLPDGVTGIGASAFQNCAMLTSVTVPDSVTSIGDWAFQGCAKMKRAVIGSGAASIGKEVFNYSSVLEAVFFQSAKPPFFDLRPFNETASNLVLYYNYRNPGDPGDPTSWVYFGANAGYTVKTCSMLTLDPNYSGSTPASYPVPSGELLGYPENVPNRSDYTFNGWYKDTACTDDWDFAAETVSGDLTLYAGWAQGAAPGNLSVISAVPSPLINGSTIITLGSLAGDGNSLVYKVGDVPVSGLTTDSTVTDGAAFSSGSTVISVIPGQYVTIYEITDPEQKVVNYVSRQVAASEIKAGANTADLNIEFSGTTATVTGYTGSGGAVVIPDTITWGGTDYTVTAIADRVYVNGYYIGAFANGKTTITSVTIPDSVTTIGSDAFKDCTVLKGVTTGNGVTSIGGSAFQGCTSLAELTLGSSVTTIGSWAFRYCSGLTKVTIPDSVTSVDVNAFRDCTGLTEVTVGSGVTSFLNSAFRDCSNLEAAYFKGVKPLDFITDSFANARSGFTLYYLSANAGSSEETNSWAYFAANTPPFAVSAASLLCTVDFDPDYSGGVVKTKTIVSLESSSALLTPPSSAPGREGYTFNGWYKDAACTDDWNFATDTISGNLTLYAGWTDGMVAGSLSITSVTPGDVKNGSTKITLGSTAGEGNSFVYKISDSAVSGLEPNSTVSDGTAFISGVTEIPVLAGQYVTIYEKTASLHYVVNYVSRQIDAAEIKPGVNTADFNFDLSGTTATVIKYTGSGGAAVVIPATINFGGTTYTVTALADAEARETGVFYDSRSAITSVTIPDSVTSLGAYSFYYCQNMTALTIPNSVTRIGDNAFYGTGLTALTIPESVTSIGEMAFAFSRGISELTIPHSITSIGYGLFWGCNGLRTVTIPDSVTSIGEKAFFNAGLTAVTIPDSVTSIGKEAFYDCRSLTAVTISDSVTSIGDSAFGRCLVLPSITIPDSVTSLGVNAFDKNRELITVTLPNSITSLGSRTFSDCSKLASVTIPDSVTSIGDNAFYNCSSLTALTIPANVTNIEGAAFSGSSKLAEIYFKSAKPPMISANAFTGTPANLVLYYLSQNAGDPADTSSWTYYAAHSTYTVKSYCLLTLDPNYSGGIAESIPASPDSSGLIGYPVLVPAREGYAFNGWYKDAACTDDWDFGSDTVSGGELTLYAGWIAGTAPGNLTVVSAESTDVNWQTVITLGSSAGTGNSFVYKISDTPAYGLTTAGTVTDGTAFTSGGVVDAVMPGQYVTIYEINAENKVVNYVCRQMADGEIKAGIDTADMSFGVSGSTATVTGYTGSGGEFAIPGTVSYGGRTYTVTEIADGTSAVPTFGSGSTTITSVTIPDSVTTIGAYAFYGCTALTSVTLGSGVTGIGNYAFRDCTGLTAVAIPDSVTTIGSHAFRGCTGLTAVTISANVTTISSSSFRDCSLLTAAYFLAGTPPSMSSTVFRDTASEFKVYYHISQADGWSEFTTYTKAAFCRLTLDLNYTGSTPESSFVTVDGEGHIAVPADPSRENYTFGGWYKEADCSNTFDFGGETVSSDVTVYAKWTADHPVYAVTPVQDPAYTIGATPDDIKTMTVNENMGGFRYFTTGISPVTAHDGMETALFVHLRDGLMLDTNAAKADFDQVDTAAAGFNVLAGDVVKVYIVDDLTNASDFNPTIFQ